MSKPMKLINGRKSVLKNITDAESYIVNWTTITRLANVVDILTNSVIGKKIKNK